MLYRAAVPRERRRGASERLDRALGPDRRWREVVRDLAAVPRERRRGASERLDQMSLSSHASRWWKTTD